MGMEWASGGGGVATSFEAGSDADLRVAFLEKNLALNTLRDVIDAGWSVTNMVDGIADEYNDETGLGVTTGLYNSGTDYYSPNTTGVLLIQSDTTDGSTTFLDSLSAKSITAFGNVMHSTSQQKFSQASSIYFDGTGDYLTIADSDDWDFGTGDFTIDMWVYPTRVTGTQYLITQPSEFWVTMSGTSIVRDGTGFATLTGTSAFTINTWHHVAYVRSSGVDTLYVNGVAKASGASTVSISGSANPMHIGSTTGGASPFQGYISEIHISKGYAAWSSDFTPPTTPYTTGAESDFYYISTPFTANSVPNTARLVLLHQPIVSTTIGTDLKAYVSRDGGSTFSEFTLSLDAAYDSDIDVITSDELNIESQPSGNSIVYKFETLNDKLQYIHGAWLQWR